MTQSAVFGQTVTFTAAASGAVLDEWALSVDGGNNWLLLGKGTTESTNNGVLTSSYTTGPFSPLGATWEIRDGFVNDPTGVPSGIQVTATQAVGVTLVGAPAMTLQPVTQTVHPGGTVTFSAAATGNPTPSVQWQFSLDLGKTWTSVSGFTSPQFTSGPLTGLENLWGVRAIFTNVNGSATSNAAFVIVSP